MRPLKVGVQLPEVEREVRWPELLDMIRAIEDLGFDSIWLGEHLLYAGRIASRAARGRRGRRSRRSPRSRAGWEFGPLVACTSFRDPGVARQAGGDDRRDKQRKPIPRPRGRLERDRDYRAFGYPYDQRVEPFRGGVHDHPRSAPRWSLPSGPRPGELPLLNQVERHRMLRLTMADADAWNSSFPNDFGDKPAGTGRLGETVDVGCAGTWTGPGRVPHRGADDPAAGRHGADPGGLRRGNRQSRSKARRQQWPTSCASSPANDHVQLILDPITTDSIQQVGAVLTELDRA